eukprot:GFUD01016727.1.p1 GENE.GFUD01016727.1~~GFUD01016727.1.p1  ORF type:complete len:391 (+),score=76.68 GFUD01016727.1:44-1216(+)
MSFILKKDPVWLESLPLSDTSAVISLLSGDGCQVAVNAVCLLATSHLVRTVLSTDHCPPAYMHHVISLPSVAGDVLQVVGTMLATGMACVSAERKMEVLEAFRILRIVPCLIDQVQIDSGTDVVENVEKELVKIENLADAAADTFDTDLNENLLGVKLEIHIEYTEESNSSFVTEKTSKPGIDWNENLPIVKSEIGLEEPEEVNSGQSINIGIGKDEHARSNILKKETLITKEKVSKLRVESVYSLQNKCSKCDETFSSKRNLIKHISFYHKRHSKFCCVHCPKKYKRMDKLLEHIQAIHEMKTFECILCPKKYNRNQLLIEHIQAVHEMKSFKCPHCEKKFRYKKSISIHIQAIHNMRKFLCHICDKKYRDKRNLRQHIEAAHGDKSAV